MMQYLKCLPDLNVLHKSVSGRAQHGSPFKWDLTETCKAVSVGFLGGAGGDVPGLTLTVSVTLGTAQSSLFQEENVSEAPIYYS